MTFLENFVAFARALPAGPRGEMERALAELMDSYDDRYDFSPGELAELKRRAAEAEPEYSDPQDIEAIFGKPFVV